MQGSIKRLVPDRGFGFVTGDDGAEYFVHRSEVSEWDRLAEGSPVTFEAAAGPKGPRAKDLRIAV
jgi:CspA family cold shock protein